MPKSPASRTQLNSHPPLPALSSNLNILGCFWQLSTRSATRRRRSRISILGLPLFSTSPEETRRLSISDSSDQETQTHPHPELDPDPERPSTQRVFNEAWIRKACEKRAKPTDFHLQGPALQSILFTSELREERPHPPPHPSLVLGTPKHPIRRPTYINRSHSSSLLAHQHRSEETQQKDTKLVEIVELISDLVRDDKTGRPSAAGTESAT